MKTEEILKRLKASKKAAQKMAQKAAQAAEEQSSRKVEGGKDVVGLTVLAVIFVLVLITAFSVLRVKNKAENLAAVLSKETLQGLYGESEFNPNKDVTHIHIQEGVDRNAAATNLGTTLPIISRFNYRSFTPATFATIGAAPWALTRNFSVNLGDAELLAFLLSKDELAQSFLERDEISLLANDPQLLAAFTKDEKTMGEFFESDVVRGVLEDERLTRTVAGSRFMSHLLISPSGKYFRQHPQEAAELITESAHLRALRDNKAVQKAVRENPYLKNIADVLLGTDKVKTAPLEQGSTLKTSQKTTAKPAAKKKGKK